jgi:hypothetical protein
MLTNYHEYSSAYYFTEIIVENFANQPVLEK